MKVLFFLALAVAIAWTAFVVFANMMKPGENRLPRRQHARRGLADRRRARRRHGGGVTPCG
jgi:hypothetical protein